MDDWWKNLKEMLLLIAGALVFFLWLVPRGYLAERRENKKGKQ